MWGSGHALIWITCLLFSLYCSSLPHDIKDISLLLLPHSLSTCQSFLFSTNQWKWPIHVPFSFFILNQFLSCVAYHIQWHQGSWRICRHLVNISKSCNLTARGQGHFTQSQMVAWGMYDVCLCALLTLPETGSPVFCWHFKAGKVAGTVNKPQSPNTFPSLNNLTKRW